MSQPLDKVGKYSKDREKKSVFLSFIDVYMNKSLSVI